MNGLDELEIARSYIGKPYNEQRLLEMFKGAHTFYPAHCDRQIKWRFNITPALYLGWENRGIDFKISVSIQDGSISYCGISKRKDNDSGLYVRNPCVELKPTQQEIRLFKRIMEYITTSLKEDAEESGF